MNDEDFDKLCNSLELAISHASGEEVTGVMVYTLNLQQNLTKEQVAPITQRFSSRFVTESDHIHTH